MMLRFLVDAIGMGRRSKISYAAQGHVRRGVRRFKILLGMVAIGTFLLALPAAALACVSASVCVAGGGTVDAGTCFGGTQNSQDICTGGGVGPGPGGGGGGSNATFMQKVLSQGAEIGLPRGLGSAALLLHGSEDEDAWDARATDALHAAYPPTPPPTGHLGMYVGSGPGGGSGASAYGGGFSARSGGFGVTDTAGLVAPGSTTGTFRDTSGSGGITGSYDASRWFGLTGNQSLWLNGFFDFRGDSASLGTSPALTALGVVGGGSFHQDSYTFGGSADYRNGTFYLSGKAGYGFGHASESQTFDASTGSYNSHGYFVDARIGNVFVLFNTTGMSGAALLPTKAPKQVVSGTMTGVDLSGHLGYANDRTDGFTDTSGFIYGAGETRFGDVGARAKLFMATANRGLLWIPYVAGTVDQLFGYSSTLTLPTQAAVVGGDIVNFQQAKTFGGAQLGLDVFSASSGWSAGVKGFYTASNDLQIVGANAYVRVPLNHAPRASRY